MSQYLGSKCRFQNHHYLDGNVAIANTGVIYVCIFIVFTIIIYSGFQSHWYDKIIILQQRLLLFRHCSTI